MYEQACSVEEFRELQSPRHFLFQLVLAGEADQNQLKEYLRRGLIAPASLPTNSAE
jgi:hypothetical protein